MTYPATRARHAGVGQILVALALVVLALTTAASSASAHVELLESDPRPGATIGSGEDEISLTLLSLDPSGPVEVTVVDESGEDVTVGAPVISERDSVVTVAVESLEPGEYTLTWSALADDGDGRNGDTFTFTVEDSALGPGIWAIWALGLGIPALVWWRGRRRDAGDERTDEADAGDAVEFRPDRFIDDDGTFPAPES